MAAETALLAVKGGLALTISRGTVPAARARLRGVGRINQPDLDASPGRFVGQNQPQLREGPAVPFVTVFAPNRDLLSQTDQVFKSECLARYDGFLYQGLGYSMVDILHVAAFTPTHLFQPAFGRAGSHPLQGGAPKNKVAAFLAHFCPRELLACAIGGHVHDPQVYPESIKGWSDVGSVFALGHMQEIHACPPDQLGTAD